MIQNSGESQQYHERIAIEQYHEQLSFTIPNYFSQRHKKQSSKTFYFSQTTSSSQESRTAIFLKNTNHQTSTLGIVIKTIGNHLFVILDKNDQSIHTRHKDQIIFDNNAVSLSYPPIRSDVPNEEEGEKPGNTNGADNNVTYAPAPVNQEIQQPPMEIESQTPESQEMNSPSSIRPHGGNSLPRKRMKTHY